MHTLSVCILQLITSNLTPMQVTVYTAFQMRMEQGCNVGPSEEPQHWRLRQREIALQLELKTKLKVKKDNASVFH